MDSNASSQTAQASQAAAPERRLAAILCADVVGYSRLMHGDDSATLGLLKESREMFAAEAGLRGGRIVNAPGDSVLAEFASVVQAVQCALELQRRFAKRNAALAEARRMRWRIGVNLGDLLADASGVYGDGVNVAARLESLCDPGGIAISGSAYEQVRDRLTLPFIDDGEHEVKNIAHPVHVYRLDVEAQDGAAPIAGARAFAHRLWKRLMRRSAQRPRRWKRLLAATLALAAVAAGLFAVVPDVTGRAWQATLSALGIATPAREARASIAVLPFANQSGDAQRDYFSDGLTEDIISALGRFSGVMVISNNAVQAYKGRQLTPAQISRELGVRYIAQGSVRQADGKLRVSVELSDAEKGTQLWSDRFEGSGQQVFEIQDQVVKNIVGQLAVKLTSLEQQRSASKPTDNLEAYDMVLRARVLLDRSERISNREARNLLAQALKLVPRYAAAHTRLAEAEYQLAVRGWIEDPQEALKRSESLAQKALAIGEPDSNVRAHGLLGHIYILQGKYAQALAEVNRALELNGSDAAAYASRGSVLLWLGRIDEAIASIETAQRFDPQLNSGPYYFLALGYHMSGRYRDAVALADRSLIKYPNFHELHVVRAMALAELGDADGARIATEQARRLSPLFQAESFGTRFADSADQEKVLRSLLKAGF